MKNCVKRILTYLFVGLMLLTHVITVSASAYEFRTGEDGKLYWYENGIRQGTYDDPKGVLGDGTVRGREIYDPATDAWYWLDSVYGGAKACGKEVWIPYIYQGEDSFTDAEIFQNSQASDNGLQQFVENAIRLKTGKWVRYDENGKMLKGWVTIDGALAECYPDQAGNTYYYDHKTGLMAKGTITLDGVTYHFDEVSGILDNPYPITPEIPETEEKSNSNDSLYYKNGETWTVPGQWSLTINFATETSDRNQYSSKNPAAVYVVDYTYQNIGYTDNYLDGLYISLDDTIVDSAGELGYSYPGDQTYYANYTPVGAKCHAESVIGVNHKGAFKIIVSKYDSNDVRQTATFVVDVGKPSESTIEEEETPSIVYDGYHNGETWTVPGQWSLTINFATETSDRNQYSSKNPAAVYVVDYTYQNIGYTDNYLDGLYISLDDTIVDSAGELGYSYPGDQTYYANYTPVGAKCHAESVIGVNHKGAFKIIVSKYDSNSVRQTATFVVDVN